MELASKYFYAKGEEQTGPHSLAEIESKIRDGEIKPDTKIWTKGMADWQTAESVDDIVNIFNEIPPSLQNAAQSDNETKTVIKRFRHQFTRADFSRERICIYFVFAHRLSCGYLRGNT